MGQTNPASLTTVEFNVTPEVAPLHIVCAEADPTGVGLTVSVLKELKPPIVYVISVVPALNAVTSPVSAFTVATKGSVLLQLPPGSPLVV